MATPVVWGNLPKAQDDSTKIDDAINAAVAEHNDDPTAHMAAGQSIDIHRANTVIDHPAGSVVADKRTFEVLIQTAFESLDGWLTVGTLTKNIGCLKMITAASTNSVAQISATPGGFTGLQWGINWFWRAVARAEYNGDQVIYMGIGGSDELGGYAGAGFKINNATIYYYIARESGGSFVYDLHEIVGADPLLFHSYRMENDQANFTLTFYLDDVQVGQINYSGDVPSDSDEMALFEIKTTNASAKWLYVTELVFSAPYNEWI